MEIYQIEDNHHYNNLKLVNLQIVNSGQSINLPYPFQNLSSNLLNLLNLLNLNVNNFFTLSNKPFNKPSKPTNPFKPNCPSPNIL